MKLLSPAFEASNTIPSKYTGEGSDISPPLEFKDVPAGTTHFTLIMDDPDAPQGTFDHWVVWNIPAEMSELREGASLLYQGRNDFGKIGYNGPLPPPGAPHRYFFKLYALKQPLELPLGSTKEDLLSAMKGHIIDSAELIGLYQR